MTNPIDALELQRCADGELSALERRAFLERLDLADGGWKALALAFLENQHFDAAAAEFRIGAPALPAAPSSAAARLPRRSPIRITQALALAASVAAAFWLGVRTGRPASHDADARPGELLARQPADGRVKPTFAGDESLASTGVSGGKARPAAVLKLPFSGMESESLSIPVYDSQAMQDEDPEIPLWPDLNLKNALSQQGYQVTSERNLLSIPLSSGERVLVPVEVSGVSYAVQ